MATVRASATGFSMSIVMSRVLLLLLLLFKFYVVDPVAVVKSCRGLALWLSKNNEPELRGDDSRDSDPGRVADCLRAPRSGLGRACTPSLISCNLIVVTRRAALCSLKKYARRRSPPFKSTVDDKTVWIT